EWVRESGMLTTPVGLTNTHSVGVVRDALVAIEAERREEGAIYWSLPVVAETWDGRLNDINGFHVRPEHVHEAVAAAASGPVAEGAGSIIVIVATDAPLLPHQCHRIAQRAALGIARTGGLGEHSSGDLMLAFATGNRVLASEHLTGLPLAQEVHMLSDEVID